MTTQLYRERQLWSGNESVEIRYVSGSFVAGTSASSPDVPRHKDTFQIQYIHVYCVCRSSRISSWTWRWGNWTSMPDSRTGWCRSAQSDPLPDYHKGKFFLQYKKRYPSKKRGLQKDTSMMRWNNSETHGLSKSLNKKILAKKTRKSLHSEICGRYPLPKILIMKEAFFSSAFWRIN